MRGAARDGRRRAIPVVAVGRLGAAARRPGRPSIAGGRAAYRYIEAGARLATAGAIDAIVTAPINKAWVTKAGFPISSHTELLQQLTGAPAVRMMLAGSRLRVVLVTTHLALAAVPKAIRSRDVAATIAIAADHLRRYHRLTSPRIAVAGLNPHAGEEGLFGREETRVIAPAIARVRKSGVHASGPYPADSLFHQAVDGKFDAVIAMYHDQGLIPLKLLHFHDAVNVTLGLPIIRTSPDHGTAYDIAGLGKADPGSMIAAIALAHDMSRASRRAHT
jgi:4-hydroxythreonine-4-phosphate dehydrogenase